MNTAIGTLVDADGDLKIMTGTGLQTISANTMNSNWTTAQVMPSVSGGVTMVKPDDVLEKYEFNQFVVEHKVQEQELIKLKEENVNYAEVIKENMAKNCAREFVKKLSFSKKHDKDLDVHSFRGRVWVFTREELVQLIDDVKQGKV
jgi:hypothetical protein